MTKTKWDFSQKTLTKTKSKFSVKINTGLDTLVLSCYTLIKLLTIYKPTKTSQTIIHKDLWIEN